MANLLLVRRYLHNVRSQSTSCKRGRCMGRCCEIRLRAACVMYTCFITSNQCPCLMRPLPCMAICRNATTRRAASNHVSLSPLPRQCGARWAVHGRQAAEMRRALRSQSRRMTMLPSFINSSGSPTTLPSLLFANVPCPCQRYFMGGEGAWDHINSCLHHASNWTCAHDHVLRALERICNDAGFATTHKRVLTSEGNRRADLEIRNIRVAQQTDLLVDVTVRHNFRGTGHNGQTQGQLRNPETRTTSSRAPLPTRSAIIAIHIAATGMWLFGQRACLPRAASTASSCA
jgi:hypothetical protein